MLADSHPSKYSNRANQPVNHYTTLQQVIRFSPSSNQCCVFTDKEYSILPRIPNKNDLHEALVNERFEEASGHIGSESETRLVECFEGIEKFHKSCLHLIAAIRDSEQANKLCSSFCRK